MRRLLVALAAVVLTLVAHATPAVEVVTRTFTSEALDRPVSYRVILPDHYDTETRRYPVLYLLHGYGGAYTNWTDRTHVTAAAGGRPLLIVTPDGTNSWYVNGATGEAWETYLTRDLIAEIDRQFRTVATRDGRVIAGLSMGGYGALKAALRHPELYAAAASFSGALDITRPHDAFNGERKPDVMAVFGPIGSETRAANDVYALASAAAPATTPYLWLAEGTDDPWLDVNREMARVLKTRGLRYEYHERPGTHDWTFWDWAITAWLADPHVPGR